MTESLLSLPAQRFDGVVYAPSGGLISPREDLKFMMDRRAKVNKRKRNRLVDESTRAMTGFTLKQHRQIRDNESIPGVSGELMKLIKRVYTKEGAVNKIWGLYKSHIDILENKVRFMTHEDEMKSIRQKHMTMLTFHRFNQIEWYIEHDKEVEKNLMKEQMSILRCLHCVVVPELLDDVFPTDLSPMINDYYFHRDDIVV